MKFRTDINGLRALAVIAVVLFHFNPSWVPGGFAGVDVFFVISGFLMTGIIFRGLENNNFSIINFYVARANRIIPALSVVCLALLVFGWYFMSPMEYRALGKHVASSMGFLSNIIYWRESGYFDAAGQEKWLLHTWSLSVEWQFYMIYPVVLVLLMKCMSLTTIKRLLVVGTVVGFIFSAYATYRWPDPAYFLLPTRAWEMMMGGLAFLYPLQNLKETSKKYLEWTGIALILASYAFISKDNLWPGYLALIPVLGAYLVILANRSGSVITDNVVMQKVGLWSYSIYLWHWPVVVLLYKTSENSSQYKIIGILVSIILGVLSYKFIESIKFKSPITLQHYLKYKPFYMVMIVGFISSAIFISGGNNASFSTINGIVKNNNLNYPRYCHVDNSNINKSKDMINCKLGVSGDIKGLLWGDSYAGQLDPFVLNIINKNQSFISRTTSHCFPNTSGLVSKNSINEYCKLVQNQSVEEINKHKYDVVILAGRWESMYNEFGEKSINELEKTIYFTAKNSKVVYVFSQPILYKKGVLESFLHSKISDIYKAKYQRNDKVASFVNKKIENIIKKSKLKNIYFVDRSELYGSKIPSDLSPNGLPYTYDQGHLSEYGSLEFSKNFMKTTQYKILKETLEGS